MKSRGLNLKVVFLILALSPGCFGQQFWRGTRYGMSKPQLKALFRAKLTPESKSQKGDAYSSLTMSESFCGGEFEARFIFIPIKSVDQVMGVQLSTGSNNTAGTIGECVLMQYIAAYGDPLTIKDGFPGKRYMFAKGSTVVELMISPETDFVFIKYGSRVRGL